MLIKPVNQVFIPGSPGVPAIAPYTVCPPPPPQNNGNPPQPTSGNPPLHGTCFFVPNLYGGTMEVCV